MKPHHGLHNCFLHFIHILHYFCLHFTFYTLQMTTTNKAFPHCFHYSTLHLLHFTPHATTFTLHCHTSLSFSAACMSPLTQHLWVHYPVFSQSSLLCCLGLFIYSFLLSFWITFNFILFSCIYFEISFHFWVSCTYRSIYFVYFA